MSDTSSAQASTSGAPAAGRATAAQVVALGRRAAGYVLRQAGDRIDRALHPLRRRRAVDRIVRLRPRSVLVICLGNICRSPYAAAILTRAVEGTEVVVDSGGFIGPNRPSPENAQAAAAGLGTDLSPHRSKLLTPELLRDHDLTIVMEPHQRRTLIAEHGVPDARVLLLGDLDPDPVMRRAIADPYGCSLDVFTECYRRIDRCIGALAPLIGAGGDRSGRSR